MIRILFWNVNNFSKNKMFNDSTWADFLASTDRQGHMVDEVIMPNPPDIFAMVEVYSRVREVGIEGTVLNPDADAGEGVLILLKEFRRKLGQHWCLVPPLNLGEGGNREAVAVFYNSQKLQFIGPYMYWNPVQGVPKAQPPDANLLNRIADYPQKWRDCLPHPNQTDNARQHNRNYGAANIPEWQSAGQWEYFSGNHVIPSPDAAPYANTRIYFPDTWHRGPFFTAFRDLTVNPQRTIKLFSVHTSPATAKNAVRNLAQVQEIANINADEVSVVAGDFNVDTFNPNENGAYGPLEQLHFAMALDCRAPANNNNNPAVDPARKPYCMTHLLPVDVATPFNNTGVAPDVTHNVYPRYGYMGSMGGFLFQTPVDSGAIDNFFVRYGANAGGPAANITVVNTVVGKPYNAIPAPNGVTNELSGGLAYPARLNNPLTMPTANPPAPGGVNPAPGVGNFRNWENFWRIHSTSDHLALAIEV